MLSALGRLGAPQLLPVTSFLVAFGLLALYSASAGLGVETTAAMQTLLLGRQLQGVAAGIALAAVLAFCPVDALRRAGPWVWCVSTVLLWATLGPHGVVRNDAQRWLALGPVTFQPLELAKIGLVLGLASWFARHGDRILDVRFAIGVPALLIGIPAAAAIAQPDFGGALLLVAFGAVLVFLAGARLSHLVASAMLTLPLLVAIGVSADYRLKRIATFWDPFVDPQGSGYQLVQSLFAFGAGGLFGRGLGAGHQKWSFLPEPHTDFIVAVVGEELGLLGISVLLVAFALLALASLGIAARARDLHGQLLAAGAGMLLWLQAAINAGVAMGRLPTTGTTLPLFSYGRSSMVVSLAAIGLILNVARPRAPDRQGWK